MADNTEELIEVACQALRECLTAGIAVHQQFQEEFPRDWKLVYNLVGEDEDLDFVLILNADNDYVRVQLMEGMTPTVQILPYARTSH